METALLIILVVVVWVSLYSHITKMNAHTDSLRKEIYNLKKYIEIQLEELKRQPQVVAEEWQPEKKEAESEKVSVPEKVLVSEKEPVSDKVSVPKVQPVLPETKKVVPPPEIKPFGLVKKKKQVDYEKYIGENLFGKIGILVLVVGMGLFVKYAIDKDWINEVFRTVLGFVVGAGLLVLSQKLKKGYRAFSSLLAGGGFAIFYVTVSMAYHYYGLFSQTAAFILLVVLTVLMSLLSVFYDRRELAIIALAGGFISPFLVSNGMGSYLVLFTYLTILNAGMFGLSLYKKWGELPVICFVATYVIMLGYTLVADLDVAQSIQLIHLLLFATLFYLIFLLPVVSVMRTDDRKINRLLVMVVVLNNFLYLYFALWYLKDLQLSYNLKGVFSLFIALVNAAIAFAVRKRKEDKSLLFSFLIGMALTFISISIPIQLDGTFITLLWATEMVVVLWLFTRFAQPVYAYFTQALVFLTVVSFLMDIENALGEDMIRPLLLNGTFATGAYAGLAFGVFAWLLRTGYRKFSGMALLAGCGVLYISFIVDFSQNILDQPLSYCVCLAFTCLALFLLQVGVGKRFPMENYAKIYAAAAGISAFTFILLSYESNSNNDSSLFLLQWGGLLVLVLHLFFFSKWYYRVFNFRQKMADRMTSFIAIVSTVLFAVAAHNLLCLLDLREESSAMLSISLSIAGFVLMGAGMRLHLKILRMLSLAVFGFVLLKLVIVDLWLLPTVGKIIVFVMLGVILLVLSFLYQKLKKVLFMDNKEEVG
ncbi:DUF2339 domain-containing protein [Parabacteroides sp.]